MNYTYNHMNVETAISNEPITPSAAFPSCQAHDPDHRWRAMVTFRFNAVFLRRNNVEKTWEHVRKT